MLYENDDMHKAKLGFKFSSKDNLEIHIVFLSYPGEEEDKKHIAVKFLLKKGNALRMHAKISKIR